MERSASKRPTRLPITVSILNSIMSKLYSAYTNTYECLLFSAVYSLAFFWFCFLEYGELAVTKPEYIERVVRVSDVSMLDTNNILDVF